MIMMSPQQSQQQYQLQSNNHSQSVAQLAQTGALNTMGVQHQSQQLLHQQHIQQAQTNQTQFNNSFGGQTSSSFGHNTIGGGMQAGSSVVPSFSSQCSSAATSNTPNSLPNCANQLMFNNNNVSGLMMLQGQQHPQQHQQHNNPLLGAVGGYLQQQQQLLTYANQSASQNSAISGGQPSCSPAYGGVGSGASPHTDSLNSQFSRLSPPTDRVNQAAASGPVFTNQSQVVGHQQQQSQNTHVTGSNGNDFLQRLIMMQQQQRFAVQHQAEANKQVSGTQNNSESVRNLHAGNMAPKTETQSQTHNQGSISEAEKLKQGALNLQTLLQMTHQQQNSAPHHQNFRSGQNAISFQDMSQQAALMVQGIVNLQQQVAASGTNNTLLGTPFNLNNLKSILQAAAFASQNNNGGNIASASAGTKQQVATNANNQSSPSFQTVNQNNQKQQSQNNGNNKGSQERSQNNGNQSSSSHQSQDQQQYMNKRNQKQFNKQQEKLQSTKGEKKSYSKAKSPSCSSSDESTSSSGKRRYSQANTNHTNNHQSSTNNSSSSYRDNDFYNQNQLTPNVPPPQQTPHEQELKRRRLEDTSRKEYLSQVTKQLTFIPCLPKFFQQAAKNNIMITAVDGKYHQHV